MFEKTTLPRALVILLLAFPTSPLLCQVPASHDHGAGHDHSAHSSGESPYVDQAGSEIKGLSATEVEQLLSGGGMGLARPAELNSYPGPKHVLELAQELGLTNEQEVEVQAIFDEMAADARELGQSIVERERILSRRFDHRHIDESTLDALTEHIGRAWGKLRAVHLRAHLATVEVLSPEQIEAYDRLRGYTG